MCLSLVHINGGYIFIQRERTMTITYQYSWKMLVHSVSAPTLRPSPHWVRRLVQVQIKLAPLWYYYCLECLASTSSSPSCSSASVNLGSSFSFPLHNLGCSFRLSSRNTLQNMEYSLSVLDQIHNKYTVRKGISFLRECHGQIKSLMR